MKTLLVIGGGVEAVPAIQAAKNMGLRVIVADGNPDAEGFLHSDGGYACSTYDVDLNVMKALAVHRHEQINGVIALAADVPVTVAAVAYAVGAHGLLSDTAKLGADKEAQKRYLRQCGVPTARGVVVQSLSEFRRLQVQLGGRVVVKPVDSRGARGVIRLSMDSENKNWPYKAPYEAWEEAMSHSPTSTVIIEEWLDGPQISTETVVCSDGQMRTPGFLDRNYSRLEEFAPYVVEDGADAPTRLTPEQRQAVIACAEQATRALVGTTPCTVKGDLVLTADGPKVIEMALRLSGGYMSSILVPVNSGVDLVGAAIKLALGETVTVDDVMPRFDQPVAIRYDIPAGCQNHPGRGRHVIDVGLTRDGAIAMCERHLPVQGVV